MKENSIFQKGIHQLVVVNTDLTEAEAMVLSLAEDEKKRNPKVFEGKTPCVYFKMPYIPPYEAFHELRNLILRVRENTGLRAAFKGIVAIEATQWLGHEEDEYFTVLLKYLFDHRDTWRAVMVLNDCTDRQEQHFLSICTRYLTPKSFRLSLFSDFCMLNYMIRKEFAQHNRFISPTCCELLATAIAQCAVKELRSLTLIERTVEEVLSYCSEDKTVTKAVIQTYLANPDSIFNLAGSKANLKGGEYPSEKNISLRG